MIQFVIAGLVVGGISAIASAGLAITSTSSGILIFAFGAMAFFVARFYYYLHTQHGWAVAPAASVSIGIASPALGVGSHRRRSVSRPRTSRHRIGIPKPREGVARGNHHRAERAARPQGTGHG